MYSQLLTMQYYLEMQNIFFDIKFIVNKNHLLNYRLLKNQRKKFFDKFSSDFNCR